MRNRFKQNPELDATLISDVNIDSKSRHELPELLAGLQYIFVTPRDIFGQTLYSNIGTL